MQVDERQRPVGAVAKATGVTVTLHHYDEIGAVLLRESEDPRPAVRRHLERIDEQLRLAEQLRSRLTHILDVLDRSAEPSGDLYVDAIEVMTRMERYYTPEQLERLSAREAERPERASHGAVRAETMEYAKRAMVAQAGG